MGKRLDTGKALGTFKSVPHIVIDIVNVFQYGQNYKTGGREAEI